MKQLCIFSLACVFVCAASVANAALLQEFLFNDANGTAIENTANNVTALQWSGDSAGDDLAGVTTNGAGQYDLSLKNNEGLGTVFLDIPDITTGNVYGVMELTWNFSTALPTAGEEEIIRLSLINSATLGSSIVTAEFDISRGADNVVRIFGNGIGTGSQDTPVAVINNTQTQTFIAVVAVNLDNDKMSVSYSADAGASFSTLGGGLLEAARYAQQVRMYLNNDFSGDATLIDRVALYDSNPYPGQIPNIPEPASLALIAIGLVGIVGRRQRG